MRKGFVRLGVESLERRDNPALPAGVGGFLPLMDVYAIGGGYTETHTSTSDFHSTVSVDESGSGQSGTFAIVISGQAHGTDVGNGSGNGYVVAGSASGDLTYHAVYHGHNDNGMLVFDDVTFTATEHRVSSYNLTYTGSSPSYYSHYLGTFKANATVSFTAVQLGGAWTLTSYSGSSDLHIHQETQWSSGSGQSGWSTEDWGYTETDSLAGSTLVRAVGNNWNNWAWSLTYPGDPPYTESASDNQTYPFDEILSYLPDLPWEYWGWHAEEPDAVNYTWHGETATEGHLTQTTVWDGDSLDIPAFTISGREWDSAHLVADEPVAYPSGGGTETYHKDELYEGGSDWSGSGSRIDGVYAGSYHVNEDAHFAAHNTLDVRNSYSAGTDEEGYTYEQLFNYAGDRTSNGTYHISHNYDDTDVGALVTASSSNFSDSSAQTSHYWGTRDGQPIDSTFTTSEAHGGSATLPPATRRADWALPAAGGPVGGVDAGLMLCQYVPPTTPPTIPRVPHPGGGIRTGAGLLQGYYNNKIAAIGEDATKKVAKLVGQEWVLLQMNQEATANGGIR